MSTAASGSPPWRASLRRRLLGQAGASRYARTLAYVVRTAKLPRLGAGPRERARLLLVLLLMPLKERSPRHRARWVRLRLWAAGGEFPFVVSELSELYALHDVLLGDEYRPPPGLAPRTVLDLGANVGASVVLWSLLYPEARIWGLEPHPDTYAKLLENTRRLPRVEVRTLAAAGSDGPARLTAGTESWAAALVDGEGAGRTVTVEGRTLDTILDELGLAAVDLVKMDIEGAEFAVLRALRDPARVRAMVGELHLTEGSADELLAGLPGFRVETRDGGAHGLLFSAVREDEL